MKISHKIAEPWTQVPSLRTRLVSSLLSFLLVSWLSEDHDLEMEKSPLSPWEKGGLILFCILHRQGPV